MKKYFKFTEFRENLKSFILVMIIMVVVQCHNTYMSVSEIIKADLITTTVWIFATLLVDWVQMKSNNSKDTNSKELGMKKYFKFTSLRKRFEFFILMMTILVMGQYYNLRMSVGDIIITDLKITVMFVFASLLVDWIQMKSNNSKDTNSKELGNN